MDGNQEAIKDRTHVTIHVQIWAQHRAKCESTRGDGKDGSDKCGNGSGCDAQSHVQYAPP